MTINLNDTIRVTLREPGVKTLRDYWNAVGGQFYEDERLDNVHPGWRSGVIKIPLFRFVNIFGPSMVMGLPPPVEMNIEVLDVEGVRPIK